MTEIDTYKFIKNTVSEELACIWNTLCMHNMLKNNRGKQVIVMTSDLYFHKTMHARRKLKISSSPTMMKNKDPAV